MQSCESAVLVVSADTQFAQIRQKILEDAGYKVISARGVDDVSQACRKQHIDLVMIAHSLPPSERRRVWVEVRKHCKTPVLQLQEKGEAEQIETNAFSQHSRTPKDLLQAVNEIVRKPKKRA
jgi:DNA-binding response OmpR family regulator